MCNKKAACIRKRVVYCTQTHYALSVRKEVCHSVKRESCDSGESLIFAQESSICATRDVCARVRVCVCVCVCVYVSVCVCVPRCYSVWTPHVVTPGRQQLMTYCNSLQRTAIHCNTWRRTQYTATLCNALRCVATYCNTQQ